jgi:hypothetical protein
MTWSTCFPTRFPNVGRFLGSFKSHRFTSALKMPALALAALPSLAVALSAPAYANLINNGGFVPDQSIGTAKSGLLTRNSTRITGWTVKTYNSTGWDIWGGVVGDGNAVSVNLDEALWAGNTGVRHYMNVPNTTYVYSADGSGWFLSFDGDDRFGSAIDQTVNGLTPGNTYSLSFFQAAGQYAPDPDLAITAWWRVAFGNSGWIDSPTMYVASGAPVSAWQPQTMSFTATSSSQVLTFLAQGTPTGGPPFALLSGVSLTDSSNPPVASTPGPLPLVGLGVAFGASRTLRRRIKLG